MPIVLRVLCILAVLAPCVLSAQRTPVMADSGARVLVRQNRGPEFRGILLAVRADSIMLRTQMEPRVAIARDKIRDIKLSMGRSRSRGARQLFLGVSGVTMVACWAIIGVAATAEGNPEGLILAPLFCAPGAAVFGLFGAMFGLMIGGDIWAPATLPDATPP